MDAVVAVAKDPDELPRRLHNGVWRTVGVRDEVKIVVLVAADGAIRTAYPIGGPGVTRNPNRPVRPTDLTVDDLALGRISDAATQLLDALADRMPAADLALYGELYQAGEFEELADALFAHVAAEDIPLSPEERDHLAALQAAG